jgi:multidrug efflux pump subunit AcrB
MDALINRRFAVPILFVLAIVGGAFSFSGAIIQYLPVDKGAFLSIKLQIGDEDPLLADKNFTSPFMQRVYLLTKPDYTEARTDRNSINIKARYKSKAAAEDAGLFLKDEAARISRISGLRVHSFSFDASQEERGYNKDFIVHITVKEREHLPDVFEQVRFLAGNIRGLDEVSLTGAPQINQVFTLNAGSALQLDSIASMVASIRNALRPLQVTFENGQKLYFKTTAHQNPAQFENTLVKVGGSVVPLYQLGSFSTELQFQEEILVDGLPALTLSASVGNGGRVYETAKLLSSELEHLMAASSLVQSVVWERNAAKLLQSDLENMQRQLFYALVAILLISLLLYRSLRVIAVLCGSILITYASTLLVFNLAGFRIDLLTFLVLAMTIGIMMDNVIVSLEQTSQTGKGSALLLRVLLACNLTTVLAFVPLWFAFPKYKGQIQQIILAAGTILFLSVGVSIILVAWLRRHGFPVALPAPATKTFAFWHFFITSRNRVRWLLVLTLLLVVGLPVQLFEIPFGMPGYEQYRLYVDLLGGIQIRLKYKLGDMYPEFKQNDWNYLQLTLHRPEREGPAAFDSVKPNLYKQLLKAGSNHSFSVLNTRSGQMNFRVAYDPLLDSLSGWLSLSEITAYVATLGNSKGKVSFLQGKFPFSNAFHQNRGSPIIELKGHDPIQLAYFARKAADLVDAMGISETPASIGEASEVYFPDDRVYLKTNPLHEKKRGINLDSTLLATAASFNSDHLLRDFKLQKWILRISGDRNPLRIEKAALVSPSENYLLATDSVKFVDLGAIQQKNHLYSIEIYADVWNLEQIFSIIASLKSRLELPGGYTAGLPEFYMPSEKILLADVLQSVAIVVILVFCINAVALNDWKTGISTAIITFLSILIFGAYLVYANQRIQPAHIVGLLLVLGLVVNGVFLHHKAFLYDFSTETDIFARWSMSFTHTGRPILISTLTTVGGLVPFMFGNKESFWFEFARTVVFCLPLGTLSTFLIIGLFENHRNLDK